MDERTVRRGYKIVCISKRKLFSFCMTLSSHHPNMVARYRVREWIKPKNGCGPLAVFTSERAARYFLEPFSKKMWYQIYECRFIPSGIGQLYYQDDEGHCHLGGTYNGCPAQTHFANAVKLIKRV